MRSPRPSPRTPNSQTPGAPATEALAVEATDAPTALVESRVERVEREDLVLFINACFACTGQREFYGDAAGQSVSIDFLHRYILGNYRRLYAWTLAAGVNHFNQAQIVLHLLASGADTPPDQRAEENALITSALERLPPPRVYRLFEALRDRRVNNRRTRALIRDYLARRPDPAFDAIKYRGRLRAAAAHAHLRLPGELGPFLFEGRKQRVYATELFETFRQAHYAREAVYRLPYTVAEGLAAQLDIPRDVFLEGISARLTALERLRLQEAAGPDRDLGLDLGRAPLTRLALYVLGLPTAERSARAAELEAALRQSAARAFRRTPYRLGRVAAILDRSYSSGGSAEKRRRPLAVALAASALLEEAAREYRAFWTPALEADRPALTVTAHGQTDLASPLLEALRWAPDLVVIVSDGWENCPPGAVTQLVRAFRARIPGADRTSIVHMNPVFDADTLAPKTLGPDLPTVGVRDAEDLLTMLGFARFAEGAAPLAELEAYLAARVARALGHTSEAEA